ncbi:MAG: type II restriction endonuclease [Ardenticatenaceae bacterium]|nr:MAG: type II restriction endonuclease [Ardenticatenaceae bacterium]
MKKGHLSNYFEGIAIKRLSAVEANPEVSNQHEFNGVNRLKRILGTERNSFSTKFIYLGEDENETIVDTGFVTWYDAREYHATRSEYRLYYPATTVSEVAAEGDLLVIGKLPDDSILVIVVRAGTTFENNILWLFNLPDEGTQVRFTVQEIEEENDPELDFASRIILTELGIEITETDENYLEVMLEKFKGKFPTTRIFSAFARETLGDISAIDNPDKAVIAWMDREEMLFRTLERHFVSDRIKDGFEDVDAFISYSLSVQNRRKSRVGHALENHLEQVFTDNSITYSRGKVTENKAKPDFIFPDIVHYYNPKFLDTRLTMLGVKSTCKDRWRQVLSEAARIENKHLLTLEPGISENQTDEMVANNLQLVIPQSLHATYKPDQQLWLVNVQSFLQLVETRQSV